MSLSLEKTNAIVDAVKYFLDNHDTFTIDNVIAELKNNDNLYYEGDIDDDRMEIEEIVDTFIGNLYPEYVTSFKKAYSYELDYDDYDEYEIPEDIPPVNHQNDEYATDKEGNKLPSNDWEYLEEDDDGANFHDTDHLTTHEIVVDKQKRINIKKVVFADAEFDDDEFVMVIGNKNKSCLYIVRQDDVEQFAPLSDEEYVVGEYQLKKGALRLGVGTILDCEPEQVIFAKANWINSDCVYIEVFFDI